MFNVVIYDYNGNRFVPYNIIPYLIECYRKEKHKPKKFEEFKKFIDEQARYRFWARCQYEVILSDWPNQSVHEKIDVYDQICMNIDIITKVLMESI